MTDVVQSAWAALDLNWWQALVTVAAILVGSSIAGLTGFGFALVIVPVLLLLFPPPTVVAVTSSLGVASGLPILVQDRVHVRGRIIGPLLIPALAGQLIGVRMLISLDSRIIKLIAGVVVITFALVVTRGRVIPGIGTRLAPVVAGLLSGVLGTSTGMAGPPIVLFLTDRAPEPRAFRASITMYFVAVNSIGLVIVGQTGSIGKREFWLAAVLLPVALAGRRLGQTMLHRVDRNQFRRITLMLLIVTGASAMLTALLGLI